jgi:hypothetical protein
LIISTKWPMTVRRSIHHCDRASGGGINVGTQNRTTDLCAEVGNAQPKSAKFFNFNLKSRPCCGFSPSQARAPALTPVRGSCIIASLLQQTPVTVGDESNAGDFN